MAIQTTPTAKAIGSGEPGAARAASSIKRAALRIPDACIAIGVSRTTIYELAARGEIKLIKIANRTLVPQSEIDRLISQALEAA